MFGRVATAAFLLGMGALNHLTDINGDTALHWAAYKGKEYDYNILPL
jgi:ankyrin repeat protein